MNFFDKLGKKATETYNATKEKTTQISGELKLKGKINDCKSKIESEYKKLGKMIYDNRTNGETTSEDDIQTVCNSITTYMKEIEKAEDDILTLKNIKKCENCSAEIALDADFCSRCGAKQPKDLPVEVHNEPVNEQNVIEVNDSINTDNLSAEVGNENNVSNETTEEKKTSVDNVEAYNEVNSDNSNDSVQENNN